MGLKIKLNLVNRNYVLHNVLTHTSNNELIGEMPAKVAELIDM